MGPTGIYHKQVSAFTLIGPAAGYAEVHAQAESVCQTVC